MGKKLTHEDNYIIWLKENKPNIEIQEKYLSMKETSKHKCLDCEHTWDVSPRNIKRVSSPCPNCRVNTRVKGIQNYKEELKERYPEYEVLSDIYINNHTPLLHKHKLCGHEWMISPKDKLRGRECIKCAQKGRRNSNTGYMSFLKTKNIKALEPYITALTKINHKCLTCGHLWGVRPNSIKSGQGCPECSNRVPWDTKRYKEYLEDTEYSILGPYVTTHIKVLHKHLICGYEWEITPKDIKGGHGCPVCAKYGFKPDKPAILYYICVNSNYYKIGITNRSVRDRYAYESTKYRIVLEKHYLVGSEAARVETCIKKKYSQSLNLKGIPELFKFTKNTEVSDYDFLGLDN